MALYSKIKFLFCGEDKNYDSNINRTFDSYGVQFNKDSEIEFAVDDDVPKKYKGSFIFFSKPGYFFHYSAPGAGKTRNHSYVTFYGDRVRDYIEAGLLDDLKPELIMVNDPVRLTQIFHQLHLELLKDKQSDKAVNLLDSLLFFLREERETVSRSLYYYEKFLAECEEMIVAHPEKEYDFRFFAKKTGVSYAHFRRLFQQYSGFAPKSFLQQNRFNLAMRYLIESDMRISEIAEMAGWKDVYFFSKQFKKKFGVSPLKFRQQKK